MLRGTRQILTSSFLLQTHNGNLQSFTEEWVEGFLVVLWLKRWTAES